MKVLTIHDLEAIKKRAENALLLREQSNEAVAEQCCGLAAGTKHLQILICGGTGCKASASHVIAEKLQQALEKNKITDQVNVITTGCFGFCEKGPIVKIIPDNTFYTQVTPEDAEEIVSEHIIGGRKIERLLYVDPKTEKAVSDSKHMDFYRKQMRIALRNCGFIDPENIEEYIGLNGYRALADSLLNGTPEAVIEEIKRSGLRGRGGGGFLPEIIPTHFDVQGLADDTGPKIMIWIFPAMLFLLPALMMISPMIDPRRRNYEKFKKSYGVILGVTEVFLFLMYGWILGAGPWRGRLSGQAV